MGAGASCSGALDLVSDTEIKAAIKSIQDWEDAQKAGQKAAQALRTVRKDSFKKAVHELSHKGSIVDRLGGPDRVHDVIQVFYRKLFGNAEVRHFFEDLPNERMRAKQMKFMRYIVGGPASYEGNLRCIHATMIREKGLDLRKFQLLQQMLTDTLQEMEVQQEVIDDILSNTEIAKAAIFTPNPDELVSGEELVQHVQEMQHPLVTAMGGPDVVQAVIQAFYKKLFSNEQLKYFFVSMSAERLRQMQFKFMRYLLAGPSWYATTGSDMRCVHARMVMEDGLDLHKFNMVVQMLVGVMDDQMVARTHARQILANVEAAKAAIFTPGPDEVASREELEAEAAAVGGEIVEALGGPGGVYTFVSAFYARLFRDEQLKYFFALSSDRLRAKQFRFLRYLVGGPSAYAALPGTSNLRCRHLALIRDKGLTIEVFDHLVKLLKGVMKEHSLPQDIVDRILANVEAARGAIFVPGPEELVTREEMVAAAEALNSDLVVRMGGAARVHNVIAAFYTRLFSDAELKYFFDTLSEKKLRNKQFKLMTYLFGGPEAYATASNGTSLRCVHARLVKENGLDVVKFNRVAAMMVQTLEDEGAPEDVIVDVVNNVEAAKAAIFTPGVDELMSYEELEAEAAAVGGEIVEALGGPTIVANFISAFYARLFQDEQLKYYFTLTSERLRAKQLKLMRYLIGGPVIYDGNLTAVHTAMVHEKGLDAARFNRLVAHLTAAAKEQGLPPQALHEILRNVESARQAILGPHVAGTASQGAAAKAQEATRGGSRPTSASAFGAGGAASGGGCPFSGKLDDNTPALISSISAAAATGGNGGNGSGCPIARAISHADSSLDDILNDAAAVLADAPSPQRNVSRSDMQRLSKQISGGIGETATAATLLRTPSKASNSGGPTVPKLASGRASGAAAASAGAAGSLSGGGVRSSGSSAQRVLLPSLGIMGDEEEALLESIASNS